jgi:hypothetical protein
MPARLSAGIASYMTRIQCPGQYCATRATPGNTVRASGSFSHSGFDDIHNLSSPIT